MNNINLPDDKLNALLAMAGKKLGKDPAELKDQLESGKLDSVLGGMDPKAAGQINSLLKNPKALEAMLGNEQVRNMLGGMLGGKK